MRRSEACVMKILTVVGARPNFMKAAPIIAAINAHNERLAESRPIDNHLEAKILKLLAYRQANAWAGYDPYRLQNGKAFAALPFHETSSARTAGELSANRRVNSRS